MIEFFHLQKSHTVHAVRQDHNGYLTGDVSCFQCLRLFYYGLNLGV
jgi:hypothetical protein